jgi:hypothetical protein
MKVIIQPEISIDLLDVVIVGIRDSFREKKIVAQIQGIPRGVLLWAGESYDSEEAQNWTNEIAKNRARYVLSLKEVPYD